MANRKYIYAIGQFSEAVRILATGDGDVRSRLLHVWRGPLIVLRSEHLPEKLRKDFLWIDKQLHKFNEDKPIQHNILKMWEKTDPRFKKNYTQLYPDPVEATLNRIKNGTGLKIAKRIYSVYSSLSDLP